MRLGVGIVAAMLGLGCQAQDWEAMKALGQHPAGQCGLVFTPDEELLEATEEAAERWSLATGCDVTVGDGGIPVYLVTEVYEDDHPVCGQTMIYSLHGETAIGYVEISASMPPGCTDTTAVVLHEMGHALGPSRGHTDDGLMSWDGGNFIDETGLVSVCSDLECQDFNPEEG